MRVPHQFLIYQSEDSTTRIDVMLEAEILWLNQKQLTDLFGKSKGAISEHIKQIFEDDELPPAGLFGLTEQSSGIAAMRPLHCVVSLRHVSVILPMPGKSEKGK